MKIDVDKFYEEWSDLKPRLIAMLDDYDAGKFTAKASPAAAAIKPLFLVAPALPGKEGAKDLLQAGQSLDTVGASLGITRVTIASGHSFDEDDASYKKRLLSEIVGPAAADAELARMAVETPESAQTAEDIKDPGNPPRDAEGLRTDGPTIKEWVDHHYPALNYPMPGYASKSTPEEIAAAVAVEEKRDEEMAAEIAAKKKDDAEKAAASEAAAAAAAAAKPVEAAPQETANAPTSAGAAAPPT